MKMFRSSASKWMEEKLLNMASGDFSMALAAKGKPPLLIVSLRKAIGSLKGMIRIVNRASERLHAKMVDMSKQSAVMAEQVEGVTSTVREIAVGMQDTSETIQHMAEEMAGIHQVLGHVGHSNGVLVRDAHLFAEKLAAGKQDMRTSKEQMLGISEDSASIHAGMQQLQSAINRITGIVKQIKEISNQTQLLALNANIEASRAGEQGKGFAVVAEEISKLAVQAQQATVSIHEQIASVTENADGLKDGIDRLQQAVGTGVVTMEASEHEFAEMSLFLERILGQMQEMDGRFTDMLSNSSSVSASLNETSAAIEQVAAGCEEVLASTEIQQLSMHRMNDDIHETTRASSSLRSVISQFKLPAGQDDHPLQTEMDRWVEHALGLRAIMVSMIDAREITEIRYWNGQKAAKNGSWQRAWRSWRGRSPAGGTGTIWPF
ncbi:methyl-accepting chemotaxis protein [Bacillus sp. 3255]|uniref:methyl-accepting chemotaxis protein n=1 Tax=Bacillus sp. 3255 TaxID=2817904 RepID=UPI00286410B7|nr:methyl-accepting chemotaxis protein [Bacillus sp. 3255]MDR6878297.1 methyl-accepting chemotaxis protein [Bacillus sp. 3255]